MTCAFCYYGVVLISTEILGENIRPVGSVLATDQYANTSFDLGFNQSVAPLDMLPSPQSLVLDPGYQNASLLESECRNPSHKMLTTSDYVKLLWTTLAEFPGKLNIILWL